MADSKITMIETSVSSPPTLATSNKTVIKSEHTYLLDPQHKSRFDFNLAVGNDPCVACGDKYAPGICSDGRKNDCPALDN